MAPADRGNDLVEDVQRLEQPFQNVGAFPGPGQLKFRAAADDLFPMLNEKLEHALQTEETGLAVDQGQHLHAEGLLERRVLEEIGQDLLGLHIARQLDDDAHARPVALVA